MLRSADDARNQYDLVPGFVKAAHVEEREFFPPPKIPPGSFNPVHHFDDNAQTGEESCLIAGSIEVFPFLGCMFSAVICEIK